MSIAIITPSRGRPDAYRELLAAVDETARGDVVHYCGLDPDDPSATRYPIPTRFSLRYLQGYERRRCGEWVNWLALAAISDGHEIVAFMGDDHRPRTRHWDDQVREAFGVMGSGLVYCADGLQDERLPTAAFWSADVIRALGWYCPPPLVHLYLDDYWLRLAKDLGRCTYLSSVTIEHMHHSVGKSVHDEVYEESDGLMGQDQETFRQFVRHEHPRVLASVKEKLGL